MPTTGHCSLVFLLPSKGGRWFMLTGFNVIWLLGEQIQCFDYLSILSSLQINHSDVKTKIILSVFNFSWRSYWSVLFSYWAHERTLGVWFGTGHMWTSYTCAGSWISKGVEWQCLGVERPGCLQGSSFASGQRALLCSNTQGKYKWCAGKRSQPLVIKNGCVM